MKDINWTTECSAAFEEAKTALATASLLHHPSPKAATHLTVDTSDVTLGAKLEQMEKNSLLTLAFYS